ncbi:hypothetical protein BKI49_31190 [Streptomyces sp. Tue6028]|uniref:Ig-like domain-containing protein n=1 Tax=Streptomyces sp. Tue6028 TaxID=2036037 RepID=UPI000BB38C64|nr:Ig-like domain-containing protein [Streptomyces sp. Tue6028]PBC59892.1 hypothetical protein BKI49_31190 [Streptomyces sp. Tue6028]
MSVPQISNRSGRTAWSRRGVLAALGAAVPAVALTGCADAGDASEESGGSPTTKASGSAEARTPTVTVTPADGTRKAAFTSPVEVTVADGTLSDVEVAGNDGGTLSGSFDDARTKWTSDRNPSSGTKYTVTAKVPGAGTHTAGFVTRAPGETFVGYFTPEANTTCGVGMPVSLDFTHAVTDRAAVERAITSGTFVHGNYWASPSVFGSSNTNHGCIGLHDAKGAADRSVPGYEFYTSSMLGDVVVVRNSGERTVDPANGLNGWNLSWTQWKAGSALR